MKGVTLISFNSFPTFFLNKEENGLIYPLLNDSIIPGGNEFTISPKNIFLNILFPFKKKGPYCHAKKKTFIICLEGKISINVFDFEQNRLVFSIDAKDQLSGVIISPGIEFDLKNESNQNCMLLHINDELFQEIS